MIGSIAAKERRRVVTADVPGAYLNAPLLKGPGSQRILMRLNRIETQFLIQKRPDYAIFTLPDGSMIVELDKALYGLVESARLWYEDVSGTLISDGFIANPYDSCVFNKNVDGEQSAIVVYVDDCLITSRNKATINTLLKLLTDK